MFNFSTAIHLQFVIHWNFGLDLSTRQNSDVVHHLSHQQLCTIRAVFTNSGHEFRMSNLQAGCVTLAHYKAVKC